MEPLVQRQCITQWMEKLDCFSWEGRGRERGGGAKSGGKGKEEGKGKRTKEGRKVYHELD